MKFSIQVRLLLFVTYLSGSILLLGTGCRSKQQAETAAPAASQASASATQAGTILVPGTTFVGSPNPVPANNPVTKLTWKANVPVVEVHLGSPNGPLFAKDGGESSAVTGSWVTDHMTFFLQDGTAKNPTDKTATLATLTISVR